MMERILIDTGPLVAIFSARDSYHSVCAEELRRLRPPLLTCWPVMMETAWLLRHHPSGVQGLLESAQSGLFELLDLDDGAIPFIRGFLHQYADLRPQIADATLVYLAEWEEIHALFTLDRRDFSVFRLRGGRTLNLLPSALP